MTRVVVMPPYVVRLQTEPVPLRFGFSVEFEWRDIGQPGVTWIQAVWSPDVPSDPRQHARCKRMPAYREALAAFTAEVGRANAK